MKNYLTSLIKITFNGNDNVYEIIQYPQNNYNLRDILGIQFIF